MNSYFGKSLFLLIWLVYTIEKEGVWETENATFLNGPYILSRLPKLKKMFSNIS